jgi:hypothetical protein
MLSPAATVVFSMFSMASMAVVHRYKNGKTTAG